MEDLWKSRVEGMAKRCFMAPDLKVTSIPTEQLHNIREREGLRAALYSALFMRPQDISNHGPECLIRLSERP